MHDIAMIQARTAFSIVQNRQVRSQVTRVTTAAVTTTVLKKLTSDSSKYLFIALSYKKHEVPAQLRTCVPKVLPLTKAPNAAHVLFN